MKRLGSILLVVLILINAAGYYLISIGLYLHQQEQSLKLSHSEYAGSDAIVVKLPLAIPYATNDQNYEDSDGNFFYNNETYRIAKKRIMNDTVFVICVKDHVEGKIRGQMKSVAKSFSDSPQNHKQGSSDFSMIKDYLFVPASLKRSIAPWVLEIAFGSFVNHYSFTLSLKILQPPRALA